MRYAIEINGSVQFENGDSPLPVGAIWPIPPELNNVALILLKIDNGILRLKTNEELQTEIQEKAEAQEKAQAEADAQAIQAEIDFEAGKSPALCGLENIYIDFLTNMWTPALRTAGIIANDFIVTVDNIDEPTNMYFLMQLRQIDYNTYDKMANEFLRLKIAITGNGGVMSKIKLH